MLIKKFRSFSESKSEATDKIFRNRSWNRNQKIIIFGIGLGVGVAKREFSESESDFGIKKLGSAGLYSPVGIHRTRTLVRSSDRMVQVRPRVQVRSQSLGSGSVFRVQVRVRVRVRIRVQIRVRTPVRVRSQSSSSSSGITKRIRPHRVFT